MTGVSGICYLILLMAIGELASQSCYIASLIDSSSSWGRVPYFQCPHFKLSDRYSSNRISDVPSSEGTRQSSADASSSW
jgi:hypothetical protein